MFSSRHFARTSWRVVALAVASAFLFTGSFNIAESWTWKERGLMDAAMMGDLKGVKGLLSKGADINTADSEGDSPLIRAAAMGHAEVVKLLVDRGADIHRKNKKGATALITGYLMGHQEVADFLMSKGAGFDSAGLTPLMKVSKDGRLQDVQKLLKKGEDVNARGKLGIHAIVWAAAGGHVRIVKLLLDKGAGVGKVGTDGESLLIQASYQGHLPVVRLLMAEMPDEVLTKTANFLPGFLQCDLVQDQFRNGLL